MKRLIMSAGILLPALHDLGWPVFDTSIVVPEFSLEGRRVDFALCHPASRLSVFVEVKKVGLSDGADRQLFEYAFHPVSQWPYSLMGRNGAFTSLVTKGVMMKGVCINLTFLSVILRKPSLDLKDTFGIKRVCSGEVLKSARSDYQNVARSRKIKAILPKAWNAVEP